MRLATWCSFLILALVLSVSAFSVATADDATITLGTDPEPPECVPNPGGEVTIFWEIEYSTTPDFVYYRMSDPDGGTVEDEMYPGDTGVSVTRVWTVPEGSDDGAYWVHVEYWSVEVGIEAVAEVVFLVCSDTPTDSDTWGSIKGLFR